MRIKKQERKDGVAMTDEQLRQLQETLLRILLDVQRVCEENAISFMLGEGTLLGAMRHQGFIPWDDDIDILMKRADYERFLQLAPAALGNRYVVQHPSTVHPYWSTFIKVRVKDAHPAFYQTHIRHLSPYCGPCIDVFPLDGVSRKDSPGLRLRCFRVKMYRWMIMYKLNAWPVTNLKGRVQKALSRFFSLEGLQRRADRAMRGHDGGEKPYTAAFSTYHPYGKMIQPSAVYEPAEAMFEGHRMPVPAGYDALLTTLYGDWRQIPPPEKRETKHQYQPRPADAKT